MNKQTKFNQIIQIISVIHIALCAGPIISSVVFIDAESINYMPEINRQNIIFTAFPLLAFILSNTLYNIITSKIDLKLPTETKLERYKSACIIRWSILEATAFIFFVLKPELTGLGCIIIFYMFLIRPSKTRIKEKLNITNLK